MSDQDKISPYNINTISSRQGMELEENNNLSNTKFSKLAS